MKRNLLSLFVSGLFSPVFMMPEAPAAGEAPKERKSMVQIPDKVESWHEVGKKEGKRVRDLLDKGEALASEVLLTYGQYLAGEEGAGDWLNGYVSSFPPNSQKVRKSEAKAVFDAMAIGEQSREITVGLDEKKEQVKETRQIQDWLLMHNEVKGYEGYGGLIRLARILRGAVSTGQGAGGGRTREPKFTDKQFSEVVERIPAATSAQAMELVEKATSQLTKLPHFQLALFREINMICNRVKVMTKGDDPNANFYLNAIGQITDIVENVLAKASSIVTPAAAPQPAKPAAQPQAQAETVRTGTSG